MRTTFNIDDDLLAAVKEISNRERVSTGEAVSGLLRKALTSTPPSSRRANTKSATGFRPLPKGKKVVTNEDVKRLRNAVGI